MQRKSVWSRLLWFFCFLLLSFAVQGESFGEEPYEVVSAPVVKNMLEKDNAVVIHVLSELEYELHHITGSINIPINKLATSDKLPADKTTPVIFYCMGHR